MPLNVKLLRKIQKRILTQPQAFFMHDWIRRKEYSSNNTFQNPDTGKVTEFTTCGTAGCIAGWAILLTEKKGDAKLIWSSQIQEKATEILGLSPGEDLIFGSPNWGTELSDAYENAKSDLCRAAVAVKAIDNLIERHKAKKPKAVLSSFESF
jgi:hypothetical protein